MHCKKYFSKFLMIMIFAAFCLMSGCARQKEPISKTGFYFDTVIQITLYDDSLESHIDACFDMAAEFEQKFSRTIENSEISQLNSLGTLVVSDDTLELLTHGLYYSRFSDGTFDITIGALSDLWNVKNNPGKLPASQDISAFLENVNYNNVTLQDHTITLMKENSAAPMCLDFGAIAKGYIADQMKEYLNSQNITEGFINLGGNILALGPKSNQQPYVIGIQKPFDEEGTVYLAVEITNGTVVSSGIYERYFQLNDTIYHHILNPQTGYPYINDLYSVTILCEKSVDGDALSTICYALGLQEGLKLIESLPDTEAIFITSEYEVITSSGMGSKIPYQVYD